MAGPARNTTDNLADRVAGYSAEIRKLDFIALLRALECEVDDKPRLGKATRVDDEFLRVSQAVSTGFKGMALDSLEPATGKHDYRLHCNFLGLLGSNGPMPMHLTEYADHRARNKRDATFREFLDIFNHRILSLFYRVSAEFDPAINGDRPATNIYDELVGAIGGYSVQAARERDAMPDAAKYNFVSWLGCKNKSPEGLENLVSDYFGFTAEVREFVGSWLTLPTESRTRLGGNMGNAQLGLSSYIGSRVWTIGHRFILSVGPLTWKELQSLKPDSARTRALYDLVRNYAGDEWDWDLELQVKDGEVGGLQLNRSCTLGFDSWLAGKRSSRLSAQSVRINHQVIAGAGTRH